MAHSLATRDVILNRRIMEMTNTSAYLSALTEDPIVGPGMEVLNFFDDGKFLLTFLLPT